MADIDLKLVLDVKVTLTLNAAEASALGALAGYGTNSFLECFYKHLGTSYLRPHERGLRSLFEKVNGTDSRVSEKIGSVRKAIADLHQKERDRAAERPKP